MSNEKAIVKFDPERGFLFDSLPAMAEAAEMLLKTGFAPRGIDTVQKVVTCWARAAELGIRPLQALEGMNVINGRLGIGGDLALAKVRSAGLLVSTPKKTYSGTIGQDDYTCTVTLQRKGEEPQDYSFSIREARLAGIYMNNWPKYPQRMVYYRALGWGLRDMFGDVLRGMYTLEELEDFQEDDTEPPWKADEAKVEENQRREYKLKATGVKFVESHGQKPSPKEAVEPAFSEDAHKPAALEPRTPAFAKKLASEQVQPSEQTQAATDQAARGLGTQKWPPQEEVKAAQEPDDIDMAPVVDVQPAPEDEPARPEWMDHVIRSISHPRFAGKKIGELPAADLLKVETQWVPKIEADMDNASADQKLEYRLFQSAIAHGKMAK
jgi:hypothetical protein